jgi:hypothetical protein
LEHSIFHIRRKKQDASYSTNPFGGEPKPLPEESITATELPHNRQVKPNFLSGLR